MGYKTFTISNGDLAQGLVGRLAEVTLEGGETVKVRIEKAGAYVSEVREVDPNTKE